MRTWKDLTEPESGPRFVCLVGIAGRGYLERNGESRKWFVCSPEQDLCEAAYTILEGRLAEYYLLAQAGRIRLADDFGTVAGSQFQYVLLRNAYIVKEWRERE